MIQALTDQDWQHEILPCLLVTKLVWAAELYRLQNSSSLDTGMGLSVCRIFLSGGIHSSACKNKLPREIVEYASLETMQRKLDRHLVMVLLRLLPHY